MHRKLIMTLQLFFTVLTTQIVTDLLIASEKVAYKHNTELVQFPTKNAFKELLFTRGFDEIAEKTGIIDSFYHNKLAHQVADPVTLDTLVSVIDSIYDEYALTEGSHPSRIRLITRSKPFLYRILLSNNPKLVTKLQDRGIL